MPAGRRDGDRAAEQRQHHRHLGRRVGVHDRADRRAPVADRGVRDVRQRQRRAAAGPGVRRPRRARRRAGPARRPAPPPSRPATWSRSGSALMSTSVAGAASRIDSRGTRLCPPASTFAPDPPARASSACWRPCGRTNANGAGFTHSWSVSERWLGGGAGAVSVSGCDSARVTWPLPALPRPFTRWKTTITMIVPSAIPLSAKFVSRQVRLTPPMPAMMPRGQADQVHRVAEVDAVLDPDLGAEQADHAVQDHRDAAEHTTGGRAHDRPELRAEPEQDGHDRGHVVRRRRVDPGGRHDPDVLGVRRRRRAAERARECGGDAVAAERPAHVGVEVGPGHLGHRLDVPGVLRDQRDDAGQHEQDERQREARGVHDQTPSGRACRAGSRSSRPP